MRSIVFFLSDKSTGPNGWPIVIGRKPFQRKVWIRAKVYTRTDVPEALKLAKPVKGETLIGAVGVEELDQLNQKVRCPHCKGRGQVSHWYAQDECRVIPCPHCSKGQALLAKEKAKPCPRCKDRGEYLYDGDPSPPQIWYTCPDCEKGKARLKAQPAPARILTCVYCGQKYPAGTPDSGADVAVLTAHIKQCEKHPMRAAEQEIVRLEKALLDIKLTCDQVVDLRHVAAYCRGVAVAALSVKK